MNAKKTERVVFVSEGASLSALIDNVYGELTSREATGLLSAIDRPGSEACPCGDASCVLCDDKGERPIDPMRAALAFLADLGVVVRTGGVSR